MIYITESLLYICFALLAGHNLLALIDQNKKPTIAMPSYLIPLIIMLIPILSFGPIHTVAVQNVTAFQISYIDMVKSVIYDLQIGQAWLWTTLGSLGLLCIQTIPVFKNDKHMPKVSFLIVLLLTIWFGYGSHAASLSTLKGLFVHTGHFIGVILWLGVLFVVAWFSKFSYHWQAFLNWYSPFAVANVLLVLVAGFTLMTFTTPQYVSSWILPYGQMLLLKHLAIIPLLWLGLTNGFLYKKYFLTQMKLHPDDLSYNPIKWLKVESIVAVIVLVFTAIMGQQNPPHTLSETLQTEAPSKLFQLLYRESYSPDIVLSLSIGLDSILLFIAALLTFYASFVAFKAKQAWLILLTSVLFILFAYLALMVSITAS